MIKQTITLSSIQFTSMSWMLKRKKLSNLAILLHASSHESIEGVVLRLDVRSQKNKV